MEHAAQLSGESCAPGAEAILAAATELFAAQGFAGTSINAVAVSARASKANIFHHFGSKQGLYLAVLKAAVQETSGLLDAVTDSGTTISGRLERFSREHLLKMLGSASAHRLVLRETLEHGDERGQALAEDVVGEAFARLVALVKEGIDAGEFRPDLDPALAATLLVSANVFFFQALPVLRHVPTVRFAEEPAGYSRGVIDILFHGMKASGEKGEA